MRFNRLSVSHRAGARTWLAMPMVNRAQVFGVLLLVSSVPRAFSDLDITLAGRVSSQIAGAIDHAGLFADLKNTEAELAGSAADRIEAASQTQAIAEIGRIISSALNIEEVYEPFADQVRNLIDFDVLSICVAERDAESGLIAHRAGDVGIGHLAGSGVPIEGSLTGEVAKVKRSIIVRDFPRRSSRKGFPLPSSATGPTCGRGCVRH